jgi:predicted amino acid-binding ACT domain protein
VAIRPAAERFDLVVAVRPLKDAAPGSGSGSVEDSDALTVSVHGADRPGIVHAVADALAGGGGNVVDLSTQLVGDPGQPVYVLTLRAAVPAGSADVVADAVMRTASELGVHCTVWRDDADVL